jgi:DNA polymerase III subunit alpha, Gram-positive type
MHNMAVTNLFDNITKKEITIKKINVYSKTKKIEIIISSKSIISARTMENFENEICGKFNIQDVSIKPVFEGEYSLERVMELYWDSIVYLVCKKTVVGKGILSGCSFKTDGDKLIIILKSRGGKVLRSLGSDRYIEAIIHDRFLLNTRVAFEDYEDNEIDKEKYLEDKTMRQRELLNHVIDSAVKESNNKKKNIKDKKNMGSGIKIIKGKKITDEPVKIKDVTNDSGKITISGDIFSVKFIDIKDQRGLCSFGVTDYTSSITVKYFIKNTNVDNTKNRIKEGIAVKVKGEIQYDRFLREPVLMASDIVEIRRETKKDEASVKRVELHLHTQMSSMDAITPVKEFVKRAAEWGHKAVAITDHGVLQAFPDAAEAAEKYGIKIIYGIECYLINDYDKEKKYDFKKQKTYHTVILVKNLRGLKNLYKIVSESHLKYFYKKPRVPKSLLDKYREDFIVGSGCESGELFIKIVEGNNEEEIKKIAEYYDYLEVQPLGNNMFLINNGKIKSVKRLKEINKYIVQLGDILGKPVIAACDVHFIDPGDEIFRRILMGGQGFSDADNQAPLYFRTTDEMLKEFDYMPEDKAYEIVVENTNKIASLTEKIIPIPNGTFPPIIEGADNKIRDISESRAREIYGDVLPVEVKKRLEKELGSIIKNKFSVMYIIARTLVKKSNENGYLVGSRGSVGSSFVAYLTGITEVNSLPPHYICEKCKYSEFISNNSAGCGFDLDVKTCPKCGEVLKKDGYDIPFETFLGFKGDKEPDIDLNFSGEFQSVAHKLTEKLFGRDNVYRAGTISTLAEKTAYGFVKNYMEDRNINVTNTEINRLVKGCTGIKKTTGQHPGGVIIVPEGKSIFDFSPIQRPANDADSDTVTTHFDYHSISGRLLKLDILGHDDPTMIRMLEDLTKIDPTSIQIGEEKTMGIFSSTEPLGVKPEDIESEVGTLGIPEFGTRFVRQMLVETRPSTFSELIRISGLSHGTDVWINNAQELIKTGTASLSEVICTRDDIMLYLIRAGLESGTAFKIMEDVRKGKSIKKEYEEQMNLHNVPEWYIESCKKIKYMFPKAHAAAYVMMAFRIAWYKVYYPEAFYAAYFTVRADEFDIEFVIHGRDRIINTIREFEKRMNKLSQKEKNMLTILEVANEMYVRGIDLLPVDIYKSETMKFQITENGLRPPLNALQGLGEAAAQNIIEARKGGKFISIEDLRMRAKLSKTVIEILKNHGCLENMPESSQMSFFNL